MAARKKSRCSGNPTFSRHFLPLSALSNHSMQRARNMPRRTSFFPPGHLAFEK
jgi:hypothetical protein